MKKFCFIFLVIVACVVAEYDYEGEEDEPYIDPADLIYKPGDVLDSTELADINIALEDVIQASRATRRVAIAIANTAGDTLIGHKVFIQGLSVGHPESIPEKGTGLLLMAKNNDSDTVGTWGVLTYNIVNTNYKLAVLWSVPWNYALNKNKFNMKIYPQSFYTDNAMWDQMYNIAGPWKASGYESRSEYGILMTGVMTDSNHAKLTVWIDSSAFDESKGPSLHTDCNYHALWFGYYCNQECSPKGWCWVNKKCNSAADCKGPLECYGNC